MPTERTLTGGCGDGVAARHRHPNDRGDAGEERTLPVNQIVAITRQFLKKPSLDMNDLNNYRPISNLSFLSKTVERLVDARFTAYTEKSSLLPLHQSAYRAQHSTETAFVHLYNDMVATVDRGEVGALVLLDICRQHLIYYRS